MLTLNRPFIRLFFTLSGGRLAGSFAAFGSSLIIARHFGADALGTLSFFLAIVGVSSVLASWGLPAVSTLFSAEYASKERKDLLRGFVRYARYKIFIGAGLALSIFSLYIFYFSSHDNTQSHNVSLLVIFFTVVLGAAMGLLHGGVLVGLERQSEGVLPDALLKPLLFLFLMGLVVFFHLDIGQVGILLLYSIGVVIAAVIVWRKVQQALFNDPERHVVSDKGRWKKTASPWMITSLVMDLSVEVHIIVAGLLASPAALAVLHIAFRFRMIAGFGLRSLYMLYIPKIIAANSKGESRVVRRHLNTLNQLAVAYSLGVFLVFVVFGEILMGVFGAEFKQGYFLLLILTATMLVRAIFGPAVALLSMKGHQKLTAVVMLTSLVLSVGSSILFYERFGLVAIAVSYTVSNLLSAVVLWWQAKRIIHIDSSIMSSLGKA